MHHFAARICRFYVRVLETAVSRRLPVPSFQVRASIGRRVNSISVWGAGLTCFFLQAMSILD